MGGQFMVAPWLVKAMRRYNNDSFANKDAYTAQVHMPGRVLQSILHWAFQSLPDEILVGIEVDHNKPHVLEVEQNISVNNRGAQPFCWPRFPDCGSEGGQSWRLIFCSSPT